MRRLTPCPDVDMSLHIRSAELKAKVAMSCVFVRVRVWKGEGGRERKMESESVGE